MKKFMAVVMAGVVFFIMGIFLSNINAHGKIFIEKAVVIQEGNAWMIVPKTSLPRGLSLEEALQLYSGKKKAISHLRNCDGYFRHFLPLIDARNICTKNCFYLSQSGKVIKKSQPHEEKWLGGCLLVQGIFLGFSCLALILLWHKIPVWAFLEFMVTYILFVLLNIYVSSLDMPCIQLLLYISLVLLYIKFVLLRGLATNWVRRWPELKNDNILEWVGELCWFIGIILTPFAIGNAESIRAKWEFLVLSLQSGVYITLALFLCNLVEAFFPTKKSE